MGLPRQPCSLSRTIKFVQYIVSRLTFIHTKFRGIWSTLRFPNRGRNLKKCLKKSKIRSLRWWHSVTMNSMFETKHEQQSRAYPRYLQKIPRQLEHFKIAILYIKDWVSYAKMPKMAIFHLFSPKKPICACCKPLKVGRQIHQHAFSMYIKNHANLGTLRYPKMTKTSRKFASSKKWGFLDNLVL